MNTPEIPTRYDASFVEAPWYQKWEGSGAFLPSGDRSKPVYSITIPPPNITGSLHMGHALCYSIQDLLGRLYRMKGYDVLILPGQDHASIATQSVVAKNLRAQGVDPMQLGREKFLEKVWEWRHESGDTILRQFRALGCSFEWGRTRFTLDESYSQAVLKVFIDWFNRGLIYRGLRVVNWDPMLQTSVSDIETERKDVKGKLYHVRYPFADGSGHVVIATTRPETMLADTAVAVHPEDARYRGLVGKNLVLPLMKREIPLLADIYPDPEFGTGAVKITPGHDANDYEVGQRHGLPILVVMDSQARINSLGGPYEGLSREEARTRVVQDLEEQGCLEKVEDHSIPMIISSRSGKFVEPMASLQWFAKQTDLAAAALEPVRDGRIKFVPSRYASVYTDWLENVRDWCISRQLWWGQRIPVYYAEDETPIAALSWEEAQEKAGEKKIVRQDDDVLDTWFSSGLWPFATLGWPEKTDDLERYYPTSTLVTAKDIIYLWVARMVMMGQDLVKEIPFGEVIIYATVLNQDGKRMSKSLGTGVDPMDLIQEAGADSLRWALLSQTGENQDLRYHPRKIDEAKAFCNKIWNATRFVLLNLEGHEDQKPEGLTLVDRWLLSRLNRLAAQVDQGLTARDFQAACQALYQFFWSELCDWYIEISKGRLTDPAQRRAPQWVLVTCLKRFFALLHPVMPFISEELNQKLPGADGSFLTQAAWPASDPTLDDPEAEQLVEGWFGAVRALRSLRAEAGASPMKALPLAYVEGDASGGLEIIRTQAWFDEVREGKPSGDCLSATVGAYDVHLPTEGLIDPAKEREKAQKDLEKRASELAKLKARLTNPDFLAKAKPDVIERDSKAAQELEDQVARLTQRLESLA
jgi:valyl-tRNA synthetase